MIRKGNKGEKMPGFVIHLAIAKIYEKNNRIEEIQKFERGTIAPDLEKNKEISHYRQNTNHPDLNRFIQTIGIEDIYGEGYFLHLVADYLFYEHFLEKWTPEIYDDYDRLNDKIVQKYAIKLPEEAEKVVKPTQGKLVLLNEEEIYQFIEIVGQIDIRKIVSQKGDYQNQIISEFIRLKQRIV